MVEKIERAAIRAKGLVFSLPRPARHHNIMWALSELGITSKDLHDQGFTTSEGRFVDRIEGARIALASGQVERLHAPPNLFSEDVWEGGADLPTPPYFTPHTPPAQTVGSGR